MRPADVARLVVLGAIWGASFIFVRVLAPRIGPWATADARILIGGALVVLYAAAMSRPAELARYGRHYVVIGVVNSAIPFTLLAFAALHLPAAYLAILNSVTPLFAAVLAALWLDEALTARKLGALACGCAGVALVSKAGAVEPDAMFGWAVAASLLGAFCYAAAGTYLRKRAADASPTAVAGWSQLAGGVLLLPPTIAATDATALSHLRDPLIVADVLALAIACSGIAYFLYYRLVRDVGPTRALTVTFLIPLFAMLWARLFLGEAITGTMLVGCALIIAGTLVVLRPASVTATQPAS